jgi:hypothetical protein
MAFLITFVPLTKYRNDRNENICQKCPELSLRDSNKCSGFKIIRSRQAIAETQLRIGISDARESKRNVSSFEDI